MAIIQIGITTGGNRKEFQASPTDLVSSYPTDCGAGSTLVVVDPITHSPGDGYYFDGIGWGKV